MKIIVLLSRTVPQITMVNLKEFNREHKPILVLIVDANGNTQRFKITQHEYDFLNFGDIPNIHKLIYQS